METASLTGSSFFLSLFRQTVYIIKDNLNPGIIGTGTSESRRDGMFIEIVIWIILSFGEAA